MVVKAEDALTWSFALGMRDLWLRGRSSMLCGTRAPRTPRRATDTDLIAYRVHSTGKRKSITELPPVHGVVAAPECGFLAELRREGQPGLMLRPPARRQVHSGRELTTCPASTRQSTLISIIDPATKPTTACPSST